MDSLEFTVRKESEAARILIAGLRSAFGEDDATLLSYAVEGETNLLEAIDAAIAEIDETEVLVYGLREKATQFEARRRAMEERVRRFRSLIEQAMAVSEQHRLRRPAATLTLRRLPPDVVVLSEADIPSEFFTPQPPPPPKLNKSALKQALQARSQQIEAASAIEDADERERALRAVRPIPGVSLDNGSYSLQIRRA